MRIGAHGAPAVLRFHPYQAVIRDLALVILLCVQYIEQDIRVLRSCLRIEQPLPGILKVLRPDLFPIAPGSVVSETENDSPPPSRMSQDLAITGAGLRFWSSSVSPTMRLAMTLAETWSVARDQSRLGGSVRRFTRNNFSSPPGETGSHEESTRSDRRMRAERAAAICGKGNKRKTACFRIGFEVISSVAV